MSTFRLTILICVVASAASRVINEENEVGDRIHADANEKRSMKARYGQRPYQVFVTNKKGSTLCGGALIEWNYVLTAAHCINQKDSSIPYSGPGIVVKAGLINIAHDEHEQKQTVTLDREHVIIHRGWDGTLGKDGSADLALLKLNENFVSNGRRAGLVKIYDQPIDKIVGRSVTISGWGITQQYTNGVDYTDDLLVSTVKHSATEANNECLVLTDTDGNVSCKGDSGGPATYGYPDKLVGITSAGDVFCGHTGKKSFYTSVYKYLDWICKNVAEKDNIADICRSTGGGTSGGGNSGGSSCYDSKSSSDCERWKGYGWCTKYSSTRNDDCKKTCGSC